MDCYCHETVVGRHNYLLRITSSIRRNSQSNRGDTLIEVLLALVVLGMAALALILTFTTSVAASAEHRQLASANIVLDSTSQEAIGSIEANLNFFNNCEPLSYYQNPANLPLSIADPSFTDPQIVAVSYWNSGTAQFGSLCQTEAPQRITLSVTSGLSGTVYTNTFVVDYPLGNSSSATNVGAAVSLFFAVSTSPLATDGIPFPTQPVVQILNSSGQPISTDLSPVNLSIYSYSGSSQGVLSGCSGNEINGAVIFTGCTLSTNGTYTLEATDGGLNSTTPPNPSFFTVVVGNSVEKIVFHQQPIFSNNSGGIFSTEPIIWVEQPSGAQDTGFTGPITLTATGGDLSNNCGTIQVTNGTSGTLNCTFEGAYYYNITDQQYEDPAYQIVASSGNATVLVPATSSSFTLNGTGPANELYFSTEPGGFSGTIPATPWPVQPAVTLEDHFGNPELTPAGTVKLVYDGTNTPVPGCSAGTSSYGVFQFSGCHGTADGSFRIDAVYVPNSGPDTITNAISTSYSISGAAASLVFTQQPVPGASGVTMLVQPIVTIYDGAGNIVTAETAPINLTATGGVLSLCSDLTPVQGVVSVRTCNFEGSDTGTYSLVATLGSLTATSQGFTPTGPGVATQLVFTTQPVAGPSETLMTSQPVIDVEDDAGNLVTTSAASISLTIQPSNSILSGCTNENAVLGVVSVINCSFAGAENTQYQMVASSPGLSPATSSSFSPTAPGVATAVVVSGCPSTLQWNVTCTAVATVEDQFSNVETGFASGVTFSSSGGSGAVTGLGTFAAAMGVAQDSLTGSVAGSVSIVATINSPQITSATPLHVTVVLVPQTVAFYSSSTDTPPAITGATTTYAPSGTYQVYAQGSASAPGSTVTFSSNTLSLCTVNANTGVVTVLGAGACSIAADASATVHYADSGPTSFALTISKAANVITPSSAPSTAVVGGAPYAASATATSGAVPAVVITTSPATVCTGSNSVNFVGAGTCTVTFTDAGNANYSPAPPVMQSITVGKGTQAALFVTSTSGIAGSPLGLTTSGGSGTGSVTYVVANGTATGCALSGTGPYSVNSTSAGTCTVTATKASDNNYNSVSSNATVVTFLGTRYWSGTTLVGKTVTTASFTAPSNEAVLIIASFESTSATTACATPTTNNNNLTVASTALVSTTNWETHAGTYYGMCAYSATGKNVAGTVEEIFTGSTPASAALQVIEITGDPGTATFALSDPNNNQSQTPSWLLSASPTSALEILFGAVANGGTPPTWTTPAGFSQVGTSITVGSGTKQYSPTVFMGASSASSIAGSFNPSFGTPYWGTIGIEIVP